MQIVELIQQLKTTNILWQAPMLICGLVKFDEEIMQQIADLQNINNVTLHPDTLILDNPKIDEIRELVEFCKITPKIANRKLIFINQIHKLNVYSANSLLKILEEAQTNVSFFMSANYRTGILNTILSRCKVITLSTTANLFEEHELLESILLFNKYYIENTLTTAGLAEELLSLLKDKTVNMLWYILYLLTYKLELDMFPDSELQLFKTENFLEIIKKLLAHITKKQLWAMFSKVQAEIVLAAKGPISNTQLLLEHVLTLQGNENGRRHNFGYQGSKGS